MTGTIARKELNLDKLSEYTREELEFYVRLLANKLERRSQELDALKAKASNRIGYGGSKNPYVK